MYSCFVGSSSLSLIFALYLTLNVVFFLIHSVFSFAILCFFSRFSSFWGSLCFVRLWCVCEFHIFPSISLFALLLPSFVCNHLTLLRLPMFFFIFIFCVCVFVSLLLPLLLLLLLTVNRTSKYKDRPHYTIQYYTVYKKCGEYFFFSLF